MAASNSSGGSGSHNTINGVLSQLGISFVKDRSACNLFACSIAVCQQTFKNPRSRSSRKRRIGASTTDSSEACAVCQDQATGCHYGAVTCDGCKGFFEQSVRGRLIYDCHFSRACDLRLQRRNHCQGCRWDRCLEVGMVASAVRKSRVLGNGVVTDSQQNSHPWSRQETGNLLHVLPEVASNLATPQPSLPSPIDTESSRCDSGDEESEWRLAHDLLISRPRPEMPISVDLVRAALTPLGTPETLGARLTELERSCLVNLFRWNKRRRLECDDFGFGAAAANWMSILLTSAVRHYLAESQAAAAAAAAEPGAPLFAAELTDRLKWLLRGREFDFEPLLDELDCLMEHIGDLCSHLLNAVLELKRDALSDIILMMGDRTEEEISASPQSDQPPVMLQAVRSIAAATSRLRSARPEQRALLLAALVSDAAQAAAVVPRPGNSVATDLLAPGEEAIRVPILFGL